MANTNVGIINLALFEIGVPAIATIGEKSDAAELASAIWDYVRNMVLEDHEWNFAKRSAKLVQVAAYADDPTDPAWDYQYTKPATCLKIRSVVDESNVKVPYVEEGDYIYSNYDNTSQDLFIRYTTVVTDPTEFSAAFINALHFKLAAFMSRKLAAKDPEPFEQKYIYALNHATGINQSQDYVEGEQGNTDWVTRR